MAITVTQIGVIGANNTGGIANATVATTVDSPAGNTIILILSGFTNLAPSDSASNAYVLDLAVPNNSQQSVQIWRCFNAAHLPVGGTITLSNGTGWVIEAIAISVAGIMSPKDQTASLSTWATTTPTIPNTGTLTAPSELVIVADALWGNNSGYNPGITHGLSGLTALTSARFSQINGANNGWQCLLASYKVVSATTPVGDAQTITAAPTVGNALIITYPQFDAAPNAPSVTHHLGFDATASQTFAWTFSDPDSGDSQSAYQLQIIKVSDGSTAYDSGKVASTVGTASLPGGTLLQNTAYQWKVRTYDASGLVGPYSALDSFSTAAAPTIAITTPATNGTVVTVNPLGLAWSYSSPMSLAETTYRVQLAVAGVTTFDSGVISGNATSYSVPLNNSTSYTATLTVTDANGTSSTTTRTFTTAFPVPATPTLALSAYTVTAQGVTVQGGLVATITNGTGGATGTDHFDLYRRPTGTTTWTRIATGIAVGGGVATYTDFAAASGQSYDYFVNAVGAAGGLASSTTQALSISWQAQQGVWLHSPSNPSGTAYYFGYNPGNHGEAFTNEVVMLPLDGRQRPIAEFSGRDSDKVTIDLTLPIVGSGNSSPDTTALQAFYAARATVCFRDTRGRKVYGVIPALTIVDGTNQNTTTLEVDAVDFSELV